jgi:hypothetical protein
MRINKYSPFAFVYFFVNKVGLPFGLLYTILLTPVFYVWLLLKGKTHITAKFVVVAFPFMLAHIINGVRIVDYLRTLFVLFTAYVFTYAFRVFVQGYAGLERIFRQLLSVNFILCLVAVPALFTPARYLFWSDQYITGSLGVMPRLRMFTYEPSYYATLFAPIFLFYFTGILLGKHKPTPLLLLKLFVPLILSFSMGVIACSAMAVAGLYGLQFLRLRMRRKVLQVFLAGLLIVVAGTGLMLVFYSNNPIFLRISDILSGNDISGNGRTFEAFQLAYLVAKEKSVWWGVGPGQLKIIGDPIIKAFYHYPDDYAQVSIPSVVPETLAIFGVFGVVLRLLVELYLFYRTRVYRNSYQTVLFVYIFIYQFTGSFITNIAEYVIWVLAFSNVFKDMDQVRALPSATATPPSQG